MGHYESWLDVTSKQGATLGEITRMRQYGYGRLSGLLMVGYLLAIAPAAVASQSITSQSISSQPTASQPVADAPTDIPATDTPDTELSAENRLATPFDSDFGGSDFDDSNFDDSEEIPEEILRTEIITGARSPLTGRPISAAEYAQLQAQLAASAGDPILNNRIRNIIFLLQLRRGLQPIVPFL